MPHEQEQTSLNNDSKETSPVRTRDLPALIDAPYPYIVFGDLQEVSERFGPIGNLTALNSLQQRMFHIQEQIMPEGSTFFSTTYRDLRTRLESIAVNEAARTDKRVGMVHIDRYIAKGIEHPNFFRLNISRGSNSNLVSRPGTTESPEEQLRSLKGWVEQQGLDEVVLMDDCLAFGTTLLPILKDIRHELPDTGVRVIVGLSSSGGKWLGIEKVKGETDVDVEALTIAKPSTENERTTGMNFATSRDMTVVGGYLSNERTADGANIAYPHFIPFAIPRKSVMAFAYRMKAAEPLLQLNRDFVQYIEQSIGRKLLVRDLVNQGFSIPYSRIECVKDKLEIPSMEKPIDEFLTDAQQVFNENAPKIEEEEAKALSEKRARRKNDI